MNVAALDPAYPMDRISIQRAGRSVGQLAFLKVSGGEGCTKTLGLCNTQSSVHLADGVVK